LARSATSYGWASGVQILRSDSSRSRQLTTQIGIEHAPRRSRTAARVLLGDHAHPSPGGVGGGGAGRPGHHGLTGTPAHGSGIVARFFGSGCMTTCVGLG
jgi:hypothetical protein